MDGIGNRKHTLSKMKKKVIMYSKKILLNVLFLVLVPFYGLAQPNLIPNPGLEEKDTGTYNGLGFYPRYWYLPNFGSPDYCDTGMVVMNGCTNSPLGWTPYWNYWGNNTDELNQSQWGVGTPHSGSAYVGMIIHRGAEYLATELRDTLRAGKNYVFQFYTILSPRSHSGTDRVGAAFTPERVTDFDNVFFSENYVAASFDAGNTYGVCLTDTSNWVLVSDTFQADGGERFMTFGNIDNVGQLVCQFIPAGGSYYFFDDFSLVCIDCNDTVSPPRPLPPAVVPDPVKGFAVYPNPATDRIRVITYVNQGEKSNFQLVDLAGQLVFTAPLIPEQNEHQFDVSALPPGAYIAVKTSENEQINQESLMLVIVK
jgi:hypothetical protein